MGGNGLGAGVVLDGWEKGLGEGSRAWDGMEG